MGAWARWLDKWARIRERRTLRRKNWYDPGARSEAAVVFIGGCSRSGTTLVREILGRHSAFAAGVETAMLVPPFDGGRVAERAQLDRRLITRMVASSHTVVDFAERFIGEQLGSARARVWVEKSPHSVGVANRLLEWFPKAIFVHVVRDGRDVVCSLRSHPQQRLVNGAIEAVETRRSMDDCAREWVAETEAGRALASHPRWLEVRYEALVTEPEATVRALCGGLGEAFEPAMIEPGSSSGPVARLLNNQQASGVIVGTRVGRWRFDLERDERLLVETVAGNLLRQLGYVADTAWVDEPRLMRSDEKADRAALTLLRRKLSEDGAEARLTVRGGCMAPLIDGGDEVELAPVSSPLEVGSMVVAETDPWGVVCHRVVGRGEGGRLVLCGDRSGWPHEVEPAAVVGDVVAVRRGALRLRLDGFATRWVGRSSLWARARHHLLGVLLRRAGVLLARWAWWFSSRAPKDR